MFKSFLINPKPSVYSTTFWYKFSSSANSFNNYYKIIDGFQKSHPFLAHEVRTQVLLIEKIQAQNRRPTLEEIKQLDFGPVLARAEPTCSSTLEPLHKLFVDTILDYDKDNKTRHDQQP
jgi:hypothetical protein